MSFTLLRDGTLENGKPGGYQQGRVDQSIADVRRHTQRWQDVVDIAWGDNPEWLDSEPGLYLAHGPDGISGALFYPSHLFNRSTMERFVRDFRLFTTTLADSPLARVSSVRTAVPMG